MLGKYSFQTANYFEHTDDIGFDFIFDYLFFSAIDTSMRQLWANAIDRLLRPNDEALLCSLMFPYSNVNHSEIDANRKKIGPPYLVTEDDYRQVLEPFGFRIALSFEVRDESEPILIIPSWYCILDTSLS
jgi:methyl halide transferase